MKVEQLSKPVLAVAVAHFKPIYAQTHRAADCIDEHVHGGICVPDDFGPVDSKEVVRLLTEALCAARALDNLLAGNPAPRRGE